jgi:hypothetical protein
MEKGQEKYYVVVKDYDGNDITEVHIGNLARSLSAEQFAELFDDFLNSGGKDQQEGEQSGKILQSTHRTLQASAIRWCFGFLKGISKDVVYTDARNEKAIIAAKQVTEMVEKGEINYGWMV